jgi:FkbM family methyltransferase
MTNPHAHRLPELVAEAKASAAQIDHVWDQQALDWPLDSSSVVVEVGGYKGRWALQIAERYAPRLYVFEPQPWAYATCKGALGDKATVLPYGLGAKSGIFAMGEWETDGCSFVKPSGEHVGRLYEISTAFSELDITHIDLLLMNIEGYEYTLLPHMLDQGILPQRLMVQFHIFDDYGVGMGRLFDRLAQAGYKVLWTYGVVLTAWERA